jgi:hypothetical protein
MAVGSFKEKFFTALGKLTGVSSAETRAIIEQIEAEEEQKRRLRNSNSEGKVEMGDVGYPALWRPSDEPLLDKCFERIREGLEPADSFQQKLERISNDQKAGTVWDFDPSIKFEPINDILPIDDLVTNMGMNRFCELLTNTGGGSIIIQVGNETGGGTLTSHNVIVPQSWMKFMASGTGTVAADTNKIRGFQRLVAENARVSILVDGFGVASGSQIITGGKFSTNVPSATITEYGCYDTASRVLLTNLPRDPNNPNAGTFNLFYDGTLFFRSQLDKNSTQFQHVQHQTMYTLSHTISQMSVF